MEQPEIEENNAIRRHEKITEDVEPSTSGGKQNVRQRKQRRGKGEKREPSVEEDKAVPTVVLPLGPADEHPQDPEVTNESFTVSSILPSCMLR